MRFGIIGGGPGGLMMSNLILGRFDDAQVTIFESTDRLGGKIRTQTFPKAESAPFEGGVAELYAAPAGVPDPLKDLIDSLGLETFPIAGEAVTLGDTIIPSEEDVGQVLGPDAGRSLEDFRTLAQNALSPADYHTRFSVKPSPDNPLRQQTYRQVLDTLHPDTQRYLEAYTHSDVAVEPHQTNALYGVINFLMNMPEYLSLYSIRGGIERLPDALAAKIVATGRAIVLLGTKAQTVEAVAGGYRVNGNDEWIFDRLICCLPAGWLNYVNWRGDLGPKMKQHQLYYSNLASYLRVTLLFARPFWRPAIAGNWWMTGGFGGSAVYDESSRVGEQTPGAILGWLIAGDAAKTFGNLPDDQVAQECINTLPSQLQDAARMLLVDVRVNRYIGEVSGLPGDAFCIKAGKDVWIDKANHPGLLVCGDYQYDGTLNGVIRSAMDCLGAFAGDQADEPLIQRNWFDVKWEERDNPYHDDHGRFTSAADAGGKAEHPEAKATTWSAKLASLPSRVGQAVKNKAAAFYGKMEAKYGPTWAKAILGVAIVTLPTPFTTPSVLAACALASLSNKFLGKRSQDLSDDQIKRAAEEAIAELLKEMEGLELSPAEEKQVKGLAAQRSFGMSWEERMNPYHKGGGPGGGQFTSAADEGGAGGKDAIPSSEELDKAPWRPGPNAHSLVTVGGKDYLMKRRYEGESDAEVVASQMGKLAGVDVAPAASRTIGDRNYTAVEMIPGVKSLKDLDSDDERAKALSQVPKADLERHALYDYMAGNTDSHEGQYAVKDNKLIGFDKEYSFGAGKGSDTGFAVPAHLDRLGGDSFTFSKDELSKAVESGGKIADALEKTGRADDAAGVRARADRLQHAVNLYGDTSVKQLSDLGSTPAQFLKPLTPGDVYGWKEEKK